MKKTVLKLKKFDYRGGTRFKKPLTSGPAILLRYLWVKAGGVDALGKRMGIVSQFFVNWQRDGKVPLRRVGEVSRVLDVSIYALNYDSVFNLLGEGPSWKEVVNAYVEDEDVRKLIFKAEKPVHAEGKAL